jgi:hypothetical protein
MCDIHGNDAIILALLKKISGQSYKWGYRGLYLLDLEVHQVEEMASVYGG